MPDTGAAGYIATWWIQAGCCSPAPMGGAVPLSATEINAWQRCSGNHLLPWEFATLRQMSVAYCNALSRGASPEAESPYDAVRNAPDATAAEARAATERNLRSMFRNVSQPRQPAPTKPSP